MKKIENKTNKVKVEIKPKTAIKKIFISQPMNGKTEEEILKVRAKIITKMEKKNYKVVDSFFKKGPENDPLYYLGKSVQLLGKCDAVYFCKDWYKNRGCVTEFIAAMQYGKEMIFE